MAVKSSGEQAGDPGAEKGVSEEGSQPRARWANKMEFYLCASTQISSPYILWSFPFLFYYHGGGTFLIPYCLSLFFCGMPVLFLGLALSQYTSQSGVTAWKKICPMFQGIGIASMVILVNTNLSTVLMPVWSLLYLYSSFKSPLPWTTCDNWWNTETCISNSNIDSSNSGVGPLDEWFNSTDFYDTSKSAEMEFWRSTNPGQPDFGWAGKFGTPLHWSLIPCLFIVWVLCYFCTWKGIKYTGKIIYTITFSYLLLIILFIRAVSLPGAGEGLRYLLMPDIRPFLSPFIWITSVSHTLFFATFLGTTLGSYNKYNNDCYRDCLILCALHICTVIFASCVCFSFIGFVARIEGVNFDHALNTGVDLLFVTFPKALSLVVGSTFWTVLYFLMTFLLTLNHQVVLLECVATNVSDLLPHNLRKRLARELLVLAICGLFILLGLLVITKGGLLLLHLIDNFGLHIMSFYFIVCFETIVIAWVYGADRFYDNIVDMIGYVPFPVPKYCWLFITPLICAILMLISSATSYYSMYGVNIWQRILGLVLMATPKMCIPVFMLISLCRNVQNTTTPSSDLCQTHPHKPALTLCKRVIRPGRPQPEMSDGGEAIMM